MKTVKFQVVGEEDYAFGVDIDPSGEFVITSGTYQSEIPRKGKLTAEQQEKLLAAIQDLGIPQEHPLPKGARGFEATLTIGEENEKVVYPFWEGALEEDEKLRNLVRLLETF